MPGSRSTIAALRVVAFTTGPPAPATSPCTFRFATAPFVQVAPGQQWGLGLLYLVFAIDVAVLYVACRWFAAVKARRRDAWLGYL